jgi:ABC-type Na+ efflux pump permease subunit
MRAAWLVARREFMERVRSRAFQIPTLLTVLIVVAVGIVAGVVGEDDGQEYTVGAVGREGQAVAGAARALGPALDVDITVERE